ncbi:MAG: hypothetical protein U9Q62_09335 [Campylobacterota bacterium]|nr:hypothetical protein [Campylobacterota bacterium]
MISSNVSSIQAHQTLMNNNANNVANTNTDGFVPTNGTVSESAGNAVTANLSEATDTGSAQSQSDLSKELTDQIVIEDVVDANAAAIKTQDQMFGTLLDIKA